MPAREVTRSRAGSAPITGARTSREFLARRVPCGVARRSQRRRMRQLSVARRIEPEAFDPTLDLLAVFVQCSRDSGHVALMLA